MGVRTIASRPVWSAVVAEGLYDRKRAGVTTPARQSHGFVREEKRQFWSTA